MRTYESIIMSRTNKTPEWRKKLTPEKRSLIIKWARKSVSKQYQYFKQRGWKKGKQRMKNSQIKQKKHERKNQDKNKANERETLC